MDPHLQKLAVGTNSACWCSQNNAWAYCAAVRDSSIEWHPYDQGYTVQARFSWSKIKLHRELFTSGVHADCCALNWARKRVYLPAIPPLKKPRSARLGWTPPVRRTTVIVVRLLVIFFFPNFSSWTVFLCYAHTYESSILFLSVAVTEAFSFSPFHLVVPAQKWISSLTN